MGYTECKSTEILYTGIYSIGVRCQRRGICSTNDLEHYAAAPLSYQITAHVSLI